ncbi:MAG: flippase [Thermoleophilia bacterium]
MPEIKIPSDDPGTGDSSYLPHVARGAIINLSGLLSRMAFLYVYTFILARVLPVDDLGSYFLMVTIINLLGLAAMVGLDLGVVRFVSLFAGEQKFGLARQVVWYGLMFGLPAGAAFTTLIFLAAPAVSERLFASSPGSVTALRVFALSIPFLVATRIYNATTQGMHRMQYQVYSRDIGEQVFKIALSVAALALGAGLLGVVWANVAALALATGISMYFALMVLPKPVPGQRAAEAAGLAENPAWTILRYSYPLALAGILVALWLQVDTLLLGYFGTTTDVGYYGVAIKLAIFGSKIITAFGTVFTPIIADLWNRQRTGELLVLYRITTRWIFILTLPVFLVMAIFADSIMSIFGAGFTAGSVALVLLATGQMFNAATGAAGLMVLMSGRSRLELLNVATTLAIDVALCVVLIPTYGLVGAAIANLVSLAVVNIMRVIEVWYFMRMIAYDRSYLKPLLAGVAGAMVAALLGHLVIGTGSLVRVGVLAGMLLAIYVAGIVIMGLDENDRMVLNLFRSRFHTV